MSETAHRTAKWTLSLATSLLTLAVVLILEVHRSGAI
jgi:hypothetical protein